eukprot:Mycagemm_TRINITY_DN9714_c0_g2::TRINITY_DN9714_c0_g2_i1::g.4823::m.4823 type:complete len:109 gc:universal TRINITY_DN9714_c0_g2_i1:485-811(+)
MYLGSFRTCCDLSRSSRYDSDAAMLHLPGGALLITSRISDAISLAAGTSTFVKQLRPASLISQASVAFFVGEIIAFNQANAPAFTGESSTYGCTARKRAALRGDAMPG